MKAKKSHPQTFKVRSIDYLLVSECHSDAVIYIKKLLKILINISKENNYVRKLWKYIHPFLFLNAFVLLSLNFTS